MKKVAARVFRIIVLVTIIITTEEFVCKKYVRWAYQEREYSDKPFKELIEQK